MGLDVSENKKVTLNDAHQKRVNTSIDDNPSSSKMSDLLLLHLLKRIKSNDDNGDGNPLIYALKDIKGYKITQVEKRKVFSTAQAILEKSKDLIDADYILPLPSNNNVCREVSKLVSTVSNIELLAPDFFKKKTVNEMLEIYGEEIPDNVNSSVQKLYKSQLKTWRNMQPSQIVSMKFINVKIRLLFSPLKLVDEIPNLAGKRVILVDDLMSSGSTMISAKSLLSEINCTSVLGICLFSPL